MKILGFSLSLLPLALAVLAWSAPAQAGQAFALCNIVDVASFNNRVHIHCTREVQACEFTNKPCQQPTAAPPTYVAVESNSPMAATAVQIVLSAIARKTYVDIFFDDNAGANPAGCNSNDCRRLIGVVAH